MVSLLLFLLVSFGVFLAAGIAVARWWILGVPLVLGAFFAVAGAIQGPGDMPTWFAIVVLVVMVAIAEAGATAGVVLRRGFASRFARPS